MAKAIRWRAASVGKSEKEAGGEVGATGEMTSKWINGHQTPSPYYLVRMIEEWPLNGHWLLSGRGPMEAQPADLIRPSRRTLEELRVWILRVLDAVASQPELAADDPLADVRGGLELTQQLATRLERAARSIQGGSR